VDEEVEKEVELVECGIINPDTTLTSTMKRR
jgi:hypothetical protein